MRIRNSPCVSRATLAPLEAAAALHREKSTSAVRSERPGWERGLTCCSGGEWGVVVRK